MQTIERIKKQIKNGNEERLTTLLDKLEEDKLPKQLQAAVNKIGNTPIDEPKIFEAIGNQSKDGMIPIVNLTLTREEAVAHSAEEIGDFIYEVIRKITSNRDEDGNFKSTQNTKECDMPDVFKVDELLKKIIKVEELRQRYITTEPSRSKKTEEKYDKASKELQDEVFESTGLKKDTLTDWEQLLVMEMTYATIKGCKAHSMGKRFQN